MNVEQDISNQRFGRLVPLHCVGQNKNGVRDDNRPENLELWTISHPTGQRVEDAVAWAREILRRYNASVKEAA